MKYALSLAVVAIVVNLCGLAYMVPAIASQPVVINNPMAVKPQAIKPVTMDPGTVPNPNGWGFPYNPQCFRMGGEYIVRCVTRLPASRY